MLFRRENPPAGLGLLEPEHVPDERPSSLLGLEAPREAAPADADGVLESDGAAELVPGVPHLMQQLQDDLARSRIREAFWMSVATHLVILIVLLFSPKLLPQHVLVPLRTSQLMQDRQLTYLALPKDRQPPAPQAPKTNVISDKN